MIRQYKISKKDTVISDYFQLEKIKLLNDAPEREGKIQISYLNDLVGLFFSRFSKLYSAEGITEEDKKKLRSYLEKIFEAIDIAYPKDISKDKNSKGKL